MNFPVAEPLSVAIIVSLIMVSVAMLLTFIRLVRGPSLADRVVALDLMTVQAVGFIAIYDVATHEPVYLRVAIVLALIAFLGTVAFAYYIERRGTQWGPQ
jgi:multicomponent Na+:H+ antiporter subunit F